MAETKEMKSGMTDQKKQAVIEQLWLSYYNDTLFAKGIITEQQRNKMCLMIKRRNFIKARSYTFAAIGKRLSLHFFGNLSNQLKKFVCLCYPAFM